MFDSYLIKSSNFGGSQVKCLIVNNIRIGYPFSSHYKIFLDRTFTNVSAVRLISSEIPNTSYTINSNIISCHSNGKLNTWPQSSKTPSSIKVHDNIIYNM